MSAPVLTSASVDMVGTRFSDDGYWWWDGTRWLPAISEDGRWRWDGRQWLPRQAIAEISVSSGPPGVSLRADTEGVALRYQLRLFRHTGLVLAWLQSSQTYEGTYEQLRLAYRSAQVHCLLLGWWSVASLLVLNWIALYRNRSALQQLNHLAGRSV